MFSCKFVPRNQFQDAIYSIIFHLNQLNRESFEHIPTWSVLKKNLMKSMRSRSSPARQCYVPPAPVASDRLGAAWLRLALQGGWSREWDTTHVDEKIWRCPKIGYPLVFNRTMENNHIYWINQLEMAIFNGKLLVYQRVPPVIIHLYIVLSCIFHEIKHPAFVVITPVYGNPPDP